MFVDVVLPIPQISNVYALDVDLQTGDIFYADTYYGTISKFQTPISGGQSVVQILGESMDSVDGLVVCSISRKVT